MSLVCTILSDKAAIMVGETRAAKVNDAGTVAGYEEGHHKVHKLGPSAAIGLVGERSFCEKVLAHARTLRDADFPALVERLSDPTVTTLPSIPDVANTWVLVAFDWKAASYQLAVWASNAESPRPRVESPNGEILLRVDGWSRAVEVAYARLDGYLRSTPEVPFGLAGEMRKAIQDAFADAAEQCDQVNSELDWIFLDDPHSPRRSCGSALFIKNRDAQGKVSRYPSAIRIAYPLPPNAPSASIGLENPLMPEVALSLPEDATDVFGVEIRDSDDSTVLHRYADVLLSISPKDPNLRYTWDNSESSVRSKALYAYSFNLIGEYSSQVDASISIPTPTTPLYVFSTSGGGTFQFVWSYVPGHGFPDWEPWSRKAGATYYAKFFWVDLASDTDFTEDVESFPYINVQNFSYYKPGASRYFRVRAGDEVGWGSWKVYGDESPILVFSGSGSPPGEGGEEIYRPTTQTHIASAYSDPEYAYDTLESTASTGQDSPTDDPKQTKWHGFSAATGSPTVVTLKVLSSAFFGSAVSGTVRLRYSTNGGSNWTTIYETSETRAQQTDPIDLSPSQDLTDVQVEGLCDWESGTGVQWHKVNDIKIETIE